MQMKRPSCHPDCQLQNNGTHVWTNHVPGCVFYKGRAPLTHAERGRLGGLKSRRTIGKWPKRMPWWEQALRNYAELKPEFPLTEAIGVLAAAKGKKS
jgi:hypothetical protein